MVIIVVIMIVTFFKFHFCLSGCTQCPLNPSLCGLGCRVRQSGVKQCFFCDVCWGECVLGASGLEGKREFTVLQRSVVSYFRKW